MVIDSHQQGVFANELHWIAEAHEPAPSPQTRAEEALSVVHGSFPRIANSISNLWGKVEFDVYMEKLLIDERGGRAGFPLDIADALLRLSRMHAESFGFGRPDDVWINSEARAKRN